MAKEDEHTIIKKPISLLLAEGETDEIFYKQIKSKFLADSRSTIQHLQGLYNINAKIISRIINYSEKHKDEKIRAYCCLDRESRYDTPPEFNLERIQKYIKDERIKRVLSIDIIRATPHIESWFFHDIEGIYEFLRVPKSQRTQKAFKPPEKFGYRDLQRLFERYDKTYTKGRKADNFINHLNMNRIVHGCKELHEGIELILSQSDDLTNLLFSTRKRKSKKS